VNEKDIDHSIVKRVQQGDIAAFESLVAKYRRKIMRLVTRFVHHGDEADDVAQDAFIKAYRALPNFRLESSFYTWLYRIAINTAKNHLMTSDRVGLGQLSREDADPAQLEESERALQDFNTPESALMNKQIEQTLKDALAFLSEERRMAIMLCEIEGLSYREIAHIMQCPVGTVRSRISRAREVIAQRLRPILGASRDSSG
jgi:RNA polymerase sigma-70 factor (ECF subfamily)